MKVTKFVFLEKKKRTTKTAIQKLLDKCLKTGFHLMLLGGQIFVKIYTVNAGLLCQKV